jgi:hypothetical protein
MYAKILLLKYSAVLLKILEPILVIMQAGDEYIVEVNMDGD